MNVVVDTDRCQGHNRCHASTQALFDIDDLGYTTATPGSVPADLEAAARLAEANCPEHAITIET